MRMMNVLSFMREEFNVDENRIYLMGSSMGGAGAMYLAAKHPHLWAAVAAGAPPIRRGSETLANFDSIRHLPVMLVHGERDALVSVEVSRQLAMRMQALGMTYEYREIPGGSHPNAIEMGGPWMIEFFDQHVRTPVLRDSGGSAASVNATVGVRSWRGNTGLTKPSAIEPSPARR